MTHNPSKSYKICQKFLVVAAILIINSLQQVFRCSSCTGVVPPVARCGRGSGFVRGLAVVLQCRLAGTWFCLMVFLSIAATVMIVLLSVLFDSFPCYNARGYGDDGIT